MTVRQLSYGGSVAAVAIAGRPAIRQESDGGQSSGGKVSRGTTGAVEVYHALRFLQGAEPLRPPLTGIVGDLVADFVADHGVVVI